MTLHLPAPQQQLALEHLAEGVIGLTADGTITYANPAAAKMLGYAPEGMVGSLAFSLFRELDDNHNAYSWADAPLAIACRGGRHHKQESAFQSHTGEEFPVAYKCVPIAAAAREETRMLLIFESILMKRMADNFLSKVAHHDPLTGLGNRQLFKNLISSAIGRAQRHSKGMAVLYLDLNGFKGVNDTLGHDAGDALLQQVADRLRRVLREADSVARMGGDEFTLILEDLLSSDEAALAAERVVKAIREPFSIGGKRVEIATSVGVACYPDDGKTLDELVKAADSAMYSVKGTPGGAWRFAKDTPAKSA
ncbi:MAG: diguanylate cyclase [Proteobacteria bacterium]|nr:diguanylate cyclase [Pseudomonadota bacterium]